MNRRCFICREEKDLYFNNKVDWWFCKDCITDVTNNYCLNYKMKGIANLLRAIADIFDKKSGENFLFYF